MPGGLLSLPEFPRQGGFCRLRDGLSEREVWGFPATPAGSVTSRPEPVLVRCLLKTFCFDRENQNHYYARPMRDGVAVDSVVFARDARELGATLEVADLTRLHDVLFNQVGQI